MINLILLSTLVLSSVPSESAKILRGNFSNIAQGFGYDTREYDVVTEDGYILSLFNIPGKKGPVLLMHGILDSADTFIIRGNRSLAVALAQNDYDVWSANARGSRYGRRHVELNPDEDKKFWDFSYHEISYYDLPAHIDFILKKTRKNTLSAVGHSQGNTVFYALGSTRPEYNEKINALIALSPVCFLNNVKPPISTVIKLLPFASKMLEALGQEEVMGDDTSIRIVTEMLCGRKKSYALCARGVFFPIGGSDPEEVDPDFFPTIIAHYPTGTSRKNGVHTAQGYFSHDFAQYDYGSRNVEVYKSDFPPKYDLSKVSMNVLLLAGRNDGISTIKDVKLLRDRLPNVEYRILNHRQFNHLDSVWGRNMDKYLFPHIFESLDKYN